MTFDILQNKMKRSGLIDRYITKKSRPGSTAGPSTSRSSSVTAASSQPDVDVASPPSPSGRQSPDVGTSANTVERFVPFTNGKAEWVGFLRSERRIGEGKGRKHKAKCVSCAAVFTGTIELLSKHKAKCPSMPQNIREQVTANTGPSKVAPVPVQSQTIEPLFEAQLKNQEECDYLLAMFFISSDIAFRYIIR